MTKWDLILDLQPVQHLKVNYCNLSPIKVLKTKKSHDHMNKCRKSI